MKWFLRHPVRATLGPALLVSLVVAATLWWELSGLWHVAPWLLCWLVAVNPVTFAVYGLDKRLASRPLIRVPEKTLLALAFVGGTLGAYLGMHFFRHKTIKGSFRIAFWLLVVVQMVLVAAAVKWVLSGERGASAP